MIDPLRFYQFRYTDEQWGEIKKISRIGDECKLYSLKLWLETQVAREALEIYSENAVKNSDKYRLKNEVFEAAKALKLAIDEYESKVFSRWLPPICSEMIRDENDLPPQVRFLNAQTKFKSLIENFAASFRSQEFPKLTESRSNSHKQACEHIINLALEGYSKIIEKQVPSSGGKAGTGPWTKFLMAAANPIIEPIFGRDQMIGGDQNAGTSTSARRMIARYATSLQTSSSRRWREFAGEH